MCSKFWIMARHHVKYRYNRIFEASHFSSISLSLIALKLSNPTFCYHKRGESDGTEAAADIWGKNFSASKCCPSAFPWASHNRHSPPLPHDAYLASAFSWWKCSMGCLQDFGLSVFSCSPVRPPKHLFSQSLQQTFSLLSPSHSLCFLPFPFEKKLQFSPL